MSSRVSIEHFFDSMIMWQTGYQKHLIDGLWALVLFYLSYVSVNKRSEQFIMLSFFFFFFSVPLLSVLLVIRFFHPRHNGQWPPTSKDFYTRSDLLHYFLILILDKEPVFPFSMLSAKQGNYWYQFYNVFGMTRSLTGDWTRDLPHSKPALYH